jgi:hypothetical protein
LSLGWGKKKPTEVYLSADGPLTQVEIGEFVKRLAAVRGVASPLRPRVAAHGRTADMPSVLALEPVAAEALDPV